MSIRIDGTNTAANPGITGADADTGLQFGTDEVSIVTGGTTQTTVDSSGRLLVGTTSAPLDAGYANLQLVSADGPSLVLARNDAATTLNEDIGSIRFYGNDGGTYQECARIAAEASGSHDNNDKPTYLRFLVTADGASSPTERLRIEHNGTSFFQSSENVIGALSDTGAGTAVRLYYGGHSRTGTGGTIVYTVWTNGDVDNTNNSYGALSDFKLKENIVDASSQWDDIKDIQIRNYNFIEGETHTQIGVVAQEVEAVSPGLISDTPDTDDEGNDLGTVTKSVKYSVLYMKAVKALQEAMTRIETLETQNASLEARLTALEGGAE
jgi:hypothetical protein